jgi:hypothetical protein
VVTSSKEERTTVLYATSIIPYPHWLNAGDNTWQLVSATLVGLMSIPAIEY